jgi:hypothetical protein
MGGVGEAQTELKGGKLAAGARKHWRGFWKRGACLSPKSSESLRSQPSRPRGGRGSGDRRKEQKARKTVVA